MDLKRLGHVAEVAAESLAEVALMQAKRHAREVEVELFLTQT